MEEHAANNIVFYVRIPKGQEQHLASIRHWDNLLVGFSDAIIWLKGMTYEQTKSVHLMRIPFCQVLKVGGERLFGLNSILSECDVPNCDWKPLAQVYPITKSNYNHNFFQLNQSVNFNLQPAENESKPIALLTDLTALMAYVNSAPKVRLQPLLWTIVDNMACIIGEPLLPLNGQVFWHNTYFFIPTGYDTKYAIASHIVSDLLNPDGRSHIFLKEDGTCFKVPMSACKPLSRFSMRETLNVLPS